MTAQPTEFQQQLANIRARIEELRQRMGFTEDNTVKPATESILKTSVEPTVTTTVENHSADHLRAALRKRSS
jgi:hypothetical protein